MEEFAALAGEGVWLPDAGGVSLEIDQGDAGGGELVVVGVGFGVFADVAAFHDDGAQAEVLETTTDFETVGAGFHEEEVVAGKFACGPGEKFPQRHVGVAGEFDGIVRGGATENGGGEGVWMAVEADDLAIRWRRRRKKSFRRSGRRDDGLAIG